MKKTSQLLLIAGAAAVAGLTIYAIRRHRKNMRAARVAQEGYETAHDVLYPTKKHSRHKLHFGPVLPE
ncbi:MAG TPA: hypothetical protein PKC69_10645 [Chitinophagaceae bacterium]|nr:hypothetical protein [Chitinophagaceae bacterium]